MPGKDAATSLPTPSSKAWRAATADSAPLASASGLSDVIPPWAAGHGGGAGALRNGKEFRRRWPDLHSVPAHGQPRLCHANAAAATTLRAPSDTTVCAKNAPHGRLRALAKLPRGVAW